MKMKADFTLKDIRIEVDFGKPIDISIPLIFGGKQPNTYDVDSASSKAVEAGDFIGDTRRGGSCNFEEYKLIPHCNGTHTECIGHITDERISVAQTLRDAFIPSALITVAPVKANETGDKYNPEKADDDFLITRESIERALENTETDFLHALIIRTLPNDDSKKTRRYMQSHPPFFSVDAIRCISSLGVNHILVDIPSVDRTFDEGKLTVHHIYWNVPEGTNHADEKEHSIKTITEMIYVPDSVSDGNYLLNLQIPNFMADAAPSRPLLYRIEKLKL
jgi:arylformamidase